MTKPLKDNKDDDIFAISNEERLNYQLKATRNEIKRLQAMVRQLDQRNIDLSSCFHSLADHITAANNLIDRHKHPQFICDVDIHTRKDQPDAK